MRPDLRRGERREEGERERRGEGKEKERENEEKIALNESRSM